MLFSVNPKPSLGEFKSLMSETNSFLNDWAENEQNYFSNRGGNLLETDVKVALDHCAKGTPFENTIEIISGQHFPDIVAAKLYGVEVKSTKSDHWISTGSSILESTRVPDVKKIYITFGKLGGNPVQFMSRPYEDCLYDIAVTHMPRYLINMELPKGATIFDKMDIPYEELRKMEKPVTPIIRYYRSKLKDGESLWWAGDSVDEPVSSTIRLWKKLTPVEKKACTVYGCVKYTDIFSGNYDQYSLWLTSQGIVNNNVRDQFSAGGKEIMRLSNGDEITVPAIFRRVKEYSTIITRNLAIINADTIAKGSALSAIVFAWCQEVSEKAKTDYSPEVILDALCMLFFNNSANNVQDTIMRLAKNPAFKKSENERSLYGIMEDESSYTDDKKKK